jgi:hypothetical protein
MKTNHILASVLLLCSAASFAFAAKEAQTGWPRTYTKKGSQLQMFAPQVDAWTDSVRLQARVAVLVTPKGAAKPSMGVIWFEAKTDTNLEKREVTISDFKLTSQNYGTEDPSYSTEVGKVAKDLFPTAKITISLDRLQAYVEDGYVPKQTPPLNNDPPPIFVSETPARLLMFDGAPAFAPVTGTGLFYAVNTNWDCFRQGEKGPYFLLDDNLWLTSAELKGPYKAVSILPPDFSKLPNTENWKNARQFIPPKPISDALRAPEIFYSDRSAELILLDGPPKFRAIAKTGLKAVDNTDSNLFFDDSTEDFYFLASGRWFRSKSLQGPWVYCTDSLPKGFAEIPDNDPKAAVLAAVPGTQAAKDAMFQAQIPQLASVNRSDAPKPTVVYAGGKPEFKHIANTTVDYAVNTASTVLKTSNGKYLLCEKGVWFDSATPDGPWALAASVPEEIYQIPPSSPVYNATYVKIYDSNPQTVTYGYTSGYMGGFIAGSVVVWGTGWYYPPYFGYGYGPYPVFYPYPYTWGCGAYYNPVTGSFWRGGYGYGPYGGFGAAAVYNPATGAYARGAAVYGPYGAAGRWGGYNPSTGTIARGGAAAGYGGAARWGQAYNPRTGTYAAGYQAANPYGSWGKGVVSQGDAWAKTGYVKGNQGGGAWGYQTSGGSQGGVVKGPGGDVYAGKDGNVYRKQDGSWQKYDNGSWNSAQGANSQLQRDAQSRANGAAREQQYRSNPSTMSGAGSRGGAYRGGGGGRRR